MKRKYRSALSLALGAVTLASMAFSAPGQVAYAAESSTYQQVIEFENSANYESNGNNSIESSQFSGYSGNGYLYLASGWGDVSFTVPEDGEYKITIASNADSYKENWLYLDDNGAGTLNTSGNYWQEDTNTYYLSKGFVKFAINL